MQQKQLNNAKNGENSPEGRKRKIYRNMKDYLLNSPVILLAVIALIFVQISVIVHICTRESLPPIPGFYKSSSFNKPT